MHSGCPTSGGMPLGLEVMDVRAEGRRGQQIMVQGHKDCPTIVMGDL